MTVTALPASRGPLKVGYVLKRFPRLSETFILNEMLALEQQGVELEVFALLHPGAEPRHDLVRSLRSPVTYLPGGRVYKSLKMDRLADGRDATRVSYGELIEHQMPPFPDLMAGKSAQEASVLAIKSMTLALLASSRRLDHLHAHFGTDAATAALMASRLSGIPFSFTAHAKDIYHTYVDARVDAEVRRRKIEQAAFVVTVSDYNRRQLIDLTGKAAAGKIHRLYNGIDLQRFRPRYAGRDAALLLGVGRLIEKKGFCDLIKACALLARRRVPFRCRIVGEGPERDALERQIQQAGLEDSIHLTGALAQEELLPIMAQATAIVLPCVVGASGDRDGLPTVLLEALALGLPAISTRLAGIPEIIEHDKCGLLVTPGEPSDLAAAIERVVANPQFCEGLGRRGRLKAEQQFDLRSNVSILREYFAETIHGREVKNRVGRDADRISHG